MLTELLRFLGGLGLFLLGMTVLTEGLRALAGDALSRLLSRFTRSALTGALSGAALTAIVQSSSATTVATVGLVSAGLITFTQALGVVFGANVGTTVTGWLVALLGFKFSLGTMMLPLLFVGVLLRLFGRSQVRHIGWALAGFAVLFLGIEQMRAGMASLEGVVTPASFPADTLGGRLLLVLAGVGITVVTQSSSAGVAMALTALDAGTIVLPQAAALVIGMDVGTTSTSALATLGGSPQTRRTGFAHVVFNLFSATSALILLSPYIAVLEAWSPGVTSRDPELALVGFHTTFELLAVLLVLPFARQFAGLMLRLFPDRGPALTRRLYLALLADPSAAAGALWRTVRDVTEETFAVLVETLRSGAVAMRLQELERAVDETRRYADGIRSEPSQAETHGRHVAALHCLDHLDRLIDRCHQHERARTVRGDPRLAELGHSLSEALTAARASLRAGAPGEAAVRIKPLRDLLKAERRPYRVRTLETVGPRFRLNDAIARLDAVRWLHRVAYHAWRIAHHLCPPESTDEIPARAELDPAEAD
jgi:phosphate:Na+ symporter